MTVISRAVTATTKKKLSLLNQTAYGDVGLLWLMSDRITFLSANPATPLQLRYSTNYYLNPNTATWTNIYTFPAGSYLGFAVELHDGEILVYVNTVSSITTTTVYKSSGFVANPATATFTQVLQTVGGLAHVAYSANQSSLGSNGVVVMSESGNQTVSGGGNTALKAIRAWISTDYGSTFAPLFNLVDWAVSIGVADPYPAHLHGVSYDEEWDRIWICYGDGFVPAPVTYAQVIYSDDRGKTWARMRQVNDYAASTANLTMQFISMGFSSDAIVFTPDLTKPGGLLVFPRVGYRKLGTPAMSVWCVMGTGGSFTRAGMLRKLNALPYSDTARMPVLWCQRTDGTTTTGIVYTTVAISHDLIEWSATQVPLPVTAQASWGITNVFGPCQNGKIYMLTFGPINTSDRVIAADLVYE